MTKIDKKPKPMKRKLEEGSNEAAELSQKQKTEKQIAIKNQASVEEVVDEEVRKEHEEEVEDDNENENRMVIAATSGSRNQGDGEANVAMWIKYLIDPLSRELLVDLLIDAAVKHDDVANRIQEIADKERAHREIFVCNISKSESKTTIVKFFEQFGEIEFCNPVCDKFSGYFLGYAFIMFKSASGARNALKEPEKTIGTCRLAFQRPDSVAATDTKIFVRNVAPELNPQKLREYFSRYGEIEEGPLGLDRCTGKPKGFCIFIYKSPESAKKALEEPVKSFEGHSLCCEKGIVGPKSGKQQHQHHHTNQHHNNPRYQRNNNSGCSTPGGHGHLMASNQAWMGGPAAQLLNPAIDYGFVASQGGGYGFNHPVIGQALLGSYGTATANGAGMSTGYGAQAMTPGTMPVYVIQPGLQGGYQTPSAGMPTGYGAQAMTPETMPGYGTQPGLQGGYQTPPPIQGSTGREQHSVGLYCGP